MHKALKIKLYPNSSQKKYLAKSFGCARKVYNLFLDKAIEDYKKGEKFTSLTKFTNHFHQVVLKSKEFDYLNEHNTKILKDSLVNLSRAFKNFFEKPNKDTGFPNFKSKFDEQTIGIYDEAFSKKVFERESFMFISKSFGNIKYKTSKEYKDIINKYKNEIIRITIKKTKSDEYYGLVVIDYKENYKLKKNSNSVGLDLGIKTFLTSSDGETFENLNLHKKHKNKIVRLQRSLARKEFIETGESTYSKRYNKVVKVKRRSNNREKARVKLAKKNKKITEIKLNNLHKISKQLINENQVIGIEDLNVKGMLKNRNLAKSIQQLNFGEFRRILTYKSLWYGRDLIVVNRFFPSSKRCSCCKVINKSLTLSDREWTCKSCGTTHDRDYNASLNIQDEVLRIYNENKIGSRYPESTLVEIVNVDDPITEMLFAKKQTVDETRKKSD
jgi:putative transposase